MPLSLTLYELASHLNHPVLCESCNGYCHFSLILLSIEPHSSHFLKRLSRKWAKSKNLFDCAKPKARRTRGEGHVVLVGQAKIQESTKRSIKSGQHFFGNTISITN
jgi:hypothetical protein